MLSDIFEDDERFTVHDVGMGIGDLNVFLKERFPNRRIIYSGSDILPEYVAESNTRFPECSFHLRDIAEQPFEDQYDYVVMSGVFHQRRNSQIRDWEDFAQMILMNSFTMCTKGLGFNFITPFVDFYQPQVYYCNLPKLLNFINDKLSRFFVIKHNYALFEFTVFIYQEAYIKSCYTQTEFQKYFKI